MSLLPCVCALLSLRGSAEEGAMQVSGRKTMKNIMLLLVCTALHPEMCSWQCLHDKLFPCPGQLVGAECISNLHSAPTTAAICRLLVTITQHHTVDDCLGQSAAQQASLCCAAVCVHLAGLCACIARAAYVLPAVRLQVTPGARVRGVLCTLY